MSCNVRTVSILLISNCLATSILAQSSIEVHLLRKVRPMFDNRVVSGFEYDSSDVVREALIHDEEIVGYDSADSSILFTDSTAKRIGRLEPSLPIGIPFILTIDGEPVLSGYFWNPTSSFGCKTCVIFASNEPRQRIFNGLPPSEDKVERSRCVKSAIIRACSITGRLEMSKGQK